VSIWAIIFFVIRWLPTAISVITAIIKAIHEIKDPAEKAAAVSELSDAVKKAKETGDLRPIEEMKDRCGLRCRIDRRRAAREARRQGA
jgi:hypothetical protein